MESERKKAGAAFWCAVAVSVALAYPVSFGPACWFNSYTGVGGGLIAAAYDPFSRRLWMREPKLVELYLESSAERNLRELSGRFSKLLVSYAEVGALNNSLLGWDEDRGPVWVNGR